ncbi:MAG: hypothetical protein QOG20_568 [Pseudonocardiales bacterium]|jgi:hypothetical protein|uniref:hypothetical protein n=1 Tax=Pseudonocardia sp. TaxID=60912 RepID=UPI00260AD19A|nr:hypothetical protein [Pseudonocardia sp.]MCW2718429.1 hypothetical protein [Pseudonocardia sp.]MDT7612954.1 hypothetical protein [Pseudonocardiales bacterium]MDT7704961.1 hypothetical protein [Pseudonocardiales bacterium]
MLVDLGFLPQSTITMGTITVVAQDPAPPPGEGEEFGKASPIALVVVILMGLALVALIVSMSKRIRRLPESFDKAEATDAGDAADKQS